MACVYLCKSCTRCGRVLPWVAFNKNLNKRRSECKVCQKKINNNYYNKEKDKVLEQQKIYRKSEEGVVVQFNHEAKRRIQQSEGEITKEQWLEMMEFFNWRCAYSGELVDKKEERSVDHIISLNKGGEHKIWNLVPMKRTYNASKQDKNMKSWYSSQKFYSNELLNKIYIWQGYAYNKWYKKAM